MKRLERAVAELMVEQGIELGQDELEDLALSVINLVTSQLTLDKSKPQRPLRVGVCLLPACGCTGEAHAM